MEIEYVDIKKLKPYKNNPRNNKNSIKLVAESIKQFGFKVPIVVNKDYEIITGHTRLEASKYLHLKEVPVIVANDLNEEQIKAFRLADNKVAEISKWDYDKLNEELKKIDKEEAELLGFINHGEEIDWDSIDEITEDNYEEPDHVMVECPYCNHEDRREKFRKSKIIKTTGNE